MKINGNIEVAGIAHIKLPTIVDSSFSAAEKGKIFLGDSGQLQFNNGTDIVTILDDSMDSPDFIATLGSEWVNEDGTFNPTNFNILLSDLLVNPLGGNDNLFSVLTTISNAVSSQASSTNKYSGSFSGSSIYAVNHDLGELYCSVTVIEGLSAISPDEYTVTYTDSNNLTITFTQPKNVDIIVIG